MSLRAPFDFIPSYKTLLDAAGGVYNTDFDTHQRYMVWHSGVDVYENGNIFIHNDTWRNEYMRYAFRNAGLYFAPVSAVTNVRYTARDGRPVHKQALVGVALMYDYRIGEAFACGWNKPIRLYHRNARPVSLARIVERYVDPRTVNDLRRRLQQHVALGRSLFAMSDSGVTNYFRAENAARALVRQALTDSLSPVDVMATTDSGRNDLTSLGALASAGHLDRIVNKVATVKIEHESICFKHKEK